MTECEVCSARGTELRRGRCWGCYLRWAETRAVGMGSACACCGERRLAFLKQIELLGAWVPMCHNCAACTVQLLPPPRSLDEIKERLSRERRGRERRIGKADTRVFPRERRGLERRAVGRSTGDDLMLVDDDLLVELPPGHDEDDDDDEPILSNETRIVEKISVRDL